MNALLIQDNIIKLGGHILSFSKETVIRSITEFNNYIYFFTFPKSKDLKWDNENTKEIWKMRCEKNPSELFCYEFNGVLKWKFAEQHIIGFSITECNGKNCLEVYAGEFRYIVDADTGEILDKVDSR